MCTAVPTPTNHWTADEQAAIDVYGRTLIEQLTPDELVYVTECLAAHADLDPEAGSGRTLEQRVWFFWHRNAAAAAAAGAAFGQDSSVARKLAIGLAADTVEITRGGWSGLWEKVHGPGPAERAG